MTTIGTSTPPSWRWNAASWVSSAAGSPRAATDITWFIASTRSLTHGQARAKPMTPVTMLSRILARSRCHHPRAASHRGRPGRSSPRVRAARRARAARGDPRVPRVRPNRLRASDPPPAAAGPSGTPSGSSGWSRGSRPSSGAGRGRRGPRTTPSAVPWAPLSHARARPRRQARRGRAGRRQRLPRRSCSRSIDSKRALKLPLPKPSEPCRSMSSKKTVGRSPSGRVKIWSR